MKNIFILLFSFALSCEVLATDQFGDQFILGGETNFLHQYPLEHYYGASLFMPTDRPDFETYFNKGCTACYRGYVATWEIENEKLYLIKVQDWEQQQECPLKDLFPESKKKKVLAIWFSGTIRIPDNYTSWSGYGPTYEKQITIHVDNGIVTEIAEVHISDAEWISRSKKILEKVKAYPSASKGVPVSSDLGEHFGETILERLQTLLWIAEFETCHNSSNISGRTSFEVEEQVVDDLNRFEFKQEHGPLSVYELLQTVAKETGGYLDVKVKNRTIVYEIKNSEQPLSPFE